MPFQKGHAANPGGRPKQKPVTDALRLALADAEKTGTSRALRNIVNKILDCAVNGESWAVAMVFDRLEGKVPQPIAGDDNLDPITVRTIVTGVPRNGD